MKPFTTIAVILFVLISVLQFIRFGMGWEVVVNGMAVPVWASAIAGLVAIVMAIMVWREMGRVAA